MGAGTGGGGRGERCAGRCQDIACGIPHIHRSDIVTRSRSQPGHVQHHGARHRTGREASHRAARNGEGRAGQIHRLAESEDDNPRRIRCRSAQQRRRSEVGNGERGGGGKGASESVIHDAAELRAMVRRRDGWNGVGGGGGSGNVRAIPLPAVGGTCGGGQHHAERRALAVRAGQRYGLRGDGRRSAGVIAQPCLIARADRSGGQRIGIETHLIDVPGPRFGIPRPGCSDLRGRSRGTSQCICPHAQRYAIQIGRHIPAVEYDSHLTKPVRHRRRHRPDARRRPVPEVDIVAIGITMQAVAHACTAVLPQGKVARIVGRTASLKEEGFHGPRAVREIPRRITLQRNAPGGALHRGVRAHRAPRRGGKRGPRLQGAAEGGVYRVRDRRCRAAIHWKGGDA